ncbi:MAG: class I SAM-dependent methyltransferase [Pseudomonadota bacterium]
MSTSSARGTSARKRRQTQADRADRHTLYQDSVQCVEAEIDFVDETFKQLRSRRAVRLREDFCGTANTSCEWVRRRRGNVAIGVDLDGEVLAWGREHNLGTLSRAQRKCLALVEGNVMTVKTDAVDVVLAMNFSYWIFKERKQLLRYFKKVRKSLSDDGVFFLDAYGGYDSFKVCKDRHRYDDYTYIWDQAEYNPINGHMTCHIHFRFPDGSRLQPAFSYNWRLWTLPEIQELLDEAGFSEVTVYWQGTDEDTGEGDGEFTPATEGDADPAWIAYLTASR